jgi:hypothetical protein
MVSIVVLRQLAPGGPAAKPLPHLKQRRLRVRAQRGVPLGEDAEIVFGAELRVVREQLAVFFGGPDGELLPALEQTHFEPREDAPRRQKGLGLRPGLRVCVLWIHAPILTSDESTVPGVFPVHGQSLQVGLAGAHLRYTVEYLQRVTPLRIAKGVRRGIDGEGAQEAGRFQERR